MTQPLSALRSRIDALDDEIFTLLKKRIDIVRQVGELKSKDKSNRCFIRSGREAEMMRRVYARFKETVFPPQAAASMWRQVIAASLNIESSLKVSVFAPENDSAAYWHAREYFGGFTPLKREQTTQRVVADVVDGRSHVGVLPLPYESTEDWWLQLGREGDLPRIFAYMPFVTSKAEFKKSGALAIAYVEPEQTADDVSFYLLHPARETSQSRLNAAFAKAALEVNWCASATPDPQRRFHLIEIKGFHPSGSAALQAFRQEAAATLEELIYLGSYATPILMD